MSFNSLPVELVSRILRSVDSPDQLYSLVAASSSCFRVFSRSAHLILSSLINGSLQPIAIRELLAVSNVPVYTGNNESRFKEQLNSFLGQYFTPGSFKLPTKKEDLAILYRLVWRVNSFVDDYFNRSILKLSRIRPNQSSTQSSDGGDNNSVHGAANTPAFPSDTELARMQRAFLRFELYCRIFPACESMYPHHRSVTSGPDQFTSFLALLSTWEVEELSCVHQYLSNIIETAIDKFEDQFVKAVLAAPGVMLPQSAPRFPIGQNAPKTNNRDLVYVQNLALGSLSIFASVEKVKLPLFLSYMSSMGIDLVYQLAHANSMNRARLIRKNCPVTRDFLPEALMRAPSNGPPTFQPGSINDEDPSRGNVGYYLFKNANMDTYLPILFSGMLNLSLRELGYVFWDARRFEDSIIHDKFQRAKSPSREEMYGSLMRVGREGAEQRLRGVKLPSIEMDRIEGEFGSERDTTTIHRMVYRFVPCP